LKATILVVANQTAASDELLEAVLERDSRMPVRLEFIVPPVGPGDESRAEAEQRLEQALARVREAGLEATGRVGEDCDAMAIVVEAYDPARHDEILVSTLPASISHWMGIDLPARVGRSTNALVTHVVVPERRAALH
jgi:hypothetical protein